MNTKLKIFAAPLFSILPLGCSQHEPPLYQGYVEAEFVRIAAPFSGVLEKLEVKRGQTVTKGTSLFVLEQENEAAARHEAEERLHVAEAQLENLKKSAKRPAELNVIKAQLDQAITAEQLSATELKRDEKLFADHFISREKLDTSIANNRRNREHVAELIHQINSAKLPGREDEILAQAATVDAARDVLKQQTWKLAQKSAGASKAGLIFDTLYAEGEWVPAGSPVVSLLPPENVKLRFFVPETIIGRLSAGQTIEANCDGCGAPIIAKITYISPQSEFTPPIIYSNASRKKLVFLVEAHPEKKDAMHLHPGQPVEISLQGAPR